MEKKSLGQLLRLDSRSWGRPVALILFLGILAGAGMASEMAISSQIRWFGAAALTCALLHFWYDGFIWSVRRREV